MADNSIPTAAGSFELQFWRLAGQLRVCLPANILTFDAATQLCTVKPGIKLKSVIAGKVTYIDLPVVSQVPIVIPYAQGAGTLLTLPIQAGDPCLLLFADRDIGTFMQTGSSAQPGSLEDADTTTPRSHHLTDAICIPGLISADRTVPQWSTSAIEMRDFDRKHFISLGPEGIVLSDSTCTMSIKEGAFKVETPGLATIIANNMTLGGGAGGTTNTLAGGLSSSGGTFVDKNGIDSSAHKHTGVQSGSSTSGSATP